MAYTQNIVKAILENNFEASLGFLKSVTDEDIKEVVFVLSNSKMQFFNQGVVIMISILTGKTNLMLEIYKNLKADINHGGKQQVVVLMKAAFKSKNIYGYFLYERPDLLQEMMKLQIVMSDGYPLISEMVIDSLKIAGLSRIKRVLIVEYLRDYYAHYNRNGIVFNGNKGVMSAYARTLFRLILDLDDFMSILDVEAFFEDVEDQYILLGLELWLEYKYDEGFYYEFIGIIEFSEKEMELLETRKQKIPILMRKLSGVSKIGAIVVKNDLVDFIHYFDLEKLIQENPEDFV